MRDLPSSLMGLRFDRLVMTYPTLDLMWTHLLAYIPDGIDTFTLIKALGVKSCYNDILVEVYSPLMSFFPGFFVLRRCTNGT
jgi:hypothetical protein